MKTLVIIGAGFSGTVTAIEFLKRRGNEVKLILINRSGLMARGLAYGTSSPHHLLNVPAGNMSALLEEPESFLGYCRSIDASASAHSFMPRQLYGQYLNSLLQDELDKSPLAEQRVAEVSHIDISTGYPIVHLMEGGKITADHVVMALGNFTPVTPAPLTDLQSCASYHADPWHAPNMQNIRPDDSVLLLGSGLTALDMLSNLIKKAHRGQISMLSRRGLLPISHRDMQGRHVQISDIYERMTIGAPSARLYMQTLRRIVAIELDKGHDWRDVLASIRSVTPKLWRDLPPSEQDRFLRHVQPYWDIHRHRVAPATHKIFTQALDCGQLQTIAGRLVSAASHDGVIQLRIRRRKQTTHEELSVNHIINCTGPNSNIRNVEQPFFTKLIADGTVSPDIHGLGLKLKDNLAVVNRAGEALPWLSYVGPMLKAKLWEATAVPELRAHSFALAVRLANEL